MNFSERRNPKSFIFFFKIQSAEVVIPGTELSTENCRATAESRCDERFDSQVLQRDSRSFYRFLLNLRLTVGASRLKRISKPFRITRDTLATGTADS